jgi:membrane protease YdiL (CAAX protease family)
MSRRAGAFALAGALVGYSATAGLALPGRRHPVVQAALGTTLAMLTRAPLGLTGPRLASGLRYGAASAAVLGAGVAVSTALPAVRERMDARVLPRPGWKWLTLQIPLGTVWSEETMYRGALGVLAESAFGPAGGQLLQAGTFGLSHIVDARALGEPVLATVVVTGAAGWMFGWLARRSGSVVAPVLAHLAINESGALAALAVQNCRKDRRFDNGQC